MRLVLIGLTLAVAGFAQVASKDTGWLSYGQNSFGWRFSQINQINTANIAQLAPRWIFQSRLAGVMETTPLVDKGVMYVTGPSNHAYALDARTGKTIWHYSNTPIKGLPLCCGEQNRGFAMIGDKLFKVDLEDRLVALDARTGDVLWRTELADYKKGYTGTVAPLAVKNLVIVGTAGAEFGTRGFVDAYDANTGNRVWRFNTVPEPGEPGSETWKGDAWKLGGGSTWITGTYDPELNLTYWGTGNPGPDLNGDVRPGDNLYTCSMIALDADTGKLKWHFQFTPHDVHDWDAVGDPVLADVTVAGRRVKALLHSNRNGFFYALDRANGKMLLAKPYTKVTWASGIAADGKPILVPNQDPSEEGTVSCPGMGGGHNWQANAYSPQTRLLYFSSTDGCHVYYKTLHEAVEGQWYQLSTVDRGPQPNAGSVIALDPSTGTTKWRYDMLNVPTGGMLATAGGLVFTGDRYGYFIALDAETGKVRWKFPTGASISAPPVTYTLDGKQFVAVASGTSIIVFSL
jgi:alcohol dehydrogenase (cytochrome c)